MKYSIVFLMLIVGCIAPEFPKWDGKWYAGNHEEGLIIYKETICKNDKCVDKVDIIKTSDERFSDYVCLTYEDLDSFMETYIVGCKEWKAGTKMKKYREYEMYDDKVDSKTIMADKFNNPVR